MISTLGVSEVRKKERVFFVSSLPAMVSWKPVWVFCRRFLWSISFWNGSQSVVCRLSFPHIGYLTLTEILPPFVPNVISYCLHASAMSYIWHTGRVWAPTELFEFIHSSNCRPWGAVQPKWVCALAQDDASTSLPKRHIMPWLKHR